MKCGITGGPRYPDHQQPSRKWPRTAARPATGTSVAPGPPPCNSRDAVPPPDRPRCSEGLHEGRGRVTSGGQTPPHPPRVPANLRGGRVMARGPGSAQGGTRGPRMCPPRASRCPCALAGWLFIVWRSWVIFAAGSSPRHPPRKEPVHVGGAYARSAFPTDNPSSVHE